MLRKILEEADRNAVAIGHFNTSDLTALKAVFEAAQELKVPVIVGVSEGERAFMGVRQVAALVRSLREEYDYPIFLNADHTHSLPKALEAAKAGFDWIVFDVSTLPFEENVRQTKAAVEALKAVRPDILVEGEIGNIGSGSEIHDAAPDLKKGLPPRRRRNSSWKRRASIPWRRPSATCTGCSRAWLPEKPGSTWISHASGRSRQRPGSS